MKSIIIEKDVFYEIMDSFISGGSKGAYESGCMKALQELGYHFDIVTGTSIGALNGLLVAQEDYQKLYELWDTLLH